MNHQASIDTKARIERYLDRLEDNGMSLETRRAYASRVRGFLSFLIEEGTPADVLEEPEAFKAALIRYRTLLQNELASPPGSINNRLTAILHFARFLGLGSIDLDRQEWTRSAPRTLSLPEKHAFVAAIDGWSRSRDKCIAMLILFAGLRLGECTRLDVSDFSDSLARLSINKRNNCETPMRDIVLTDSVLQAVRQWIAERNATHRNSGEDALFTTPQGKRLTSAGIDFVVRSIGLKAGVVVSAQVLRNTYVTDLVATRKDVLVVAELAGYRSLDSTKHYFTPELRAQQ